METPIRINDSIASRDIYVGHTVRLFKATRQTQYLTTAAVFLIPTFLVGLHDFLAHNEPFPSISCLGTIVLAYAFFGVPLLYRSSLGKAYDKIPAGSLKADFMLTPTHLISDTDLVHSKLKWAAIDGAVEYQHWLILHLRSRASVIIDTQKIQPPATTAAVRALLTQQNIPFGIEKIVRLVRSKK